MIPKLTRPLKIGIILTLLSTAFLAGGFWIFKEDNQVLQNISQQKAGSVFGRRADIPSQWPEDISIPNNCSLMSSSEHYKRDQKIISLNLETTQTPQEILNFFHRNLEKNNWERFMNFQLEGGESWVYQKENQKLELLVWKDINADKSFISMSLKQE